VFLESPRIPAFLKRRKSAISGPVCAGPFARMIRETAAEEAGGGLGSGHIG